MVRNLERPVLAHHPGRRGAVRALPAHHRHAALQRPAAGQCQRQGYHRRRSAPYPLRTAADRRRLRRAVLAARLAMAARADPLRLLLVQLVHSPIRRPCVHAPQHHRRSTKPAAQSADVADPAARRVGSVPSSASGGVVVLLADAGSSRKSRGRAITRTTGGNGWGRAWQRSRPRRFSSPLSPPGTRGARRKSPCSFFASINT